ncbi:MAG TPA: hypothetical protein VN667_19825 [Burkholderiales bacterium]|nr:hypothetical protein [Burkholderiales bacterium]
MTARGAGRGKGLARRAGRELLGLSSGEYRTLARLNTPEKIQAFVDSIPQNFEIGGITCLSVREVLRQRRALCIEGAMVAACALWINGEPPWLFDLKAEHDFDHVVAVFRRGNCWGAVSKTNSPILRWRDPVYRNLRELAMSYFHEYTNRRHQKTLRSYSVAFDLRRMDPALWVTNSKQCWEVGWALEAARHYPLVARRQQKLLRLKDGIEREAQKLKMYKPPQAKPRR